MKETIAYSLIIHMNSKPLCNLFESFSKLLGDTCKCFANMLVNFTMLSWGWAAQGVTNK